MSSLAERQALARSCREVLIRGVSGSLETPLVFSLASRQSSDDDRPDCSQRSVEAGRGISFPPVCLEEIQTGYPSRGLI